MKKKIVENYFVIAIFQNFTVFGKMETSPVSLRIFFKLTI